MKRLFVTSNFFIFHIVFRIFHLIDVTVHMMQKDGRYGWLVVGATFMVGVITDGLAFSYGVLLIELLRTFNKGRASTAIIGSLITGFMHLVGPVAGLLSEKYGYRLVVITGSLISAVGFFISVFVDELEYLYVTYGFCGGVGFGLMLLPASVCVIQHFERRRSLANGIAVCGSGVGAFAFNLITGYLLEIYGWRGAVLIQSGIVLNGIVCGLIFVAPESDDKTEQQEEEIDQSQTSERNLNKSDIENKLYDGIHINKSSKTCSTVVGDNQIKYTQDERDTNKVCNKKITDTRDSIEQISDETKLKDSLKNDTLTGVQICKNQSKLCIISGANFSNDIPEFPNSKYATDKGVPGITCSEFDANNESLPKDSLGSMKDNNFDSTRKSRDNIVSSMETVLRTLCNITLLRDKKLLAFLLSGFLVNLAFTVPFNLIADQAVENDMTKHEAYWLASSIGIANTVSRVIIGWIADRKFINRLVLLLCLLTLVGLSTILSVFLLSFTAKMIYTCVFGFLVGGYIALCPVVLVDLFGEDVIARSYGLFWFAVGISGFVSTPIAGLLFDRTGSYVISFITAGSEFILGAVVLIFPFLSVRRNINKDICNS